MCQHGTMKKKSLEADLEERCRLLVKARGGELLKFKSPGNKGVQDRLLLLPGGFMALIEFKRAKKSKFQPLQLFWHKRVLDLGHRAWIVSDYKTFKLLLPTVLL